MANAHQPAGRKLLPSSPSITAPYLQDATDGAHAARREANGLRVFTECLPFTTSRGPQFIDITDAVSDVVARSGIQNGFAVIFSRHTTAAIRINENEPGVIRDMESMLQRIAPPSAYYLHNDFNVRTVNITDDEDANGHSHCQHLLLGSSENVPIINGSLHFGQWQRLFLIELDKPRSREVIVQLIGI